MSYTVLIFEDDPDWQERHRKTFQQLGFEITVTSQFLDAQNAIDEANPPFDIVVVDMNLSGETEDDDDRRLGLTMLQHIHEMGRGEQCFVISAETFEMKELKEFGPLFQEGVIVDTFDKGDGSKLRSQLLKRVPEVLRSREAQVASEESAGNANRVFVSYRRADSPGVTGRIYDHLVDAVGKENVFKDVDSILPGDTFPTVLADRLDSSDILLVIIGKNWMMKDDKGRNRLDNPGDYVRIEIETALKRNILVIPTMVDFATLPAESELPPSLRALLQKQTSEIRYDPDFENDIQKLIKIVKEHTPRTI